MCGKWVAKEKDFSGSNEAFPMRNWKEGVDVQLFEEEWWEKQFGQKN